MRRTPVAAVLASLLLAASVSACGSEDEAIPPLPLTWNARGKYDGSVTLRDDGTGTFVNVPHGAGEECDASGQIALNGDFTWRHEKDHLYIATIGDFKVAFGPRSVPFGFDWDKIVVYTCEGETGLDDPTTSYRTFIPPGGSSS